MACSSLKYSYLLLHVQTGHGSLYDKRSCSSAVVLLEQWKEEIPDLTYLCGQTRINTWKSTRSFLVFISSSLNLHSPTSNTLLAGTFTELLPPWDAVRRALGWLHWNYKWFYLGRRAETPFSWVDKHGHVVSGTSFLTKFQITKQPAGLLSFGLHCTAKHCPSLE